MSHLQIAVKHLQNHVPEQFWTHPDNYVTSKINGTYPIDTDCSYVWLAHIPAKKIRIHKTKLAVRRFIVDSLAAV
jgi:hypothetical protein